MHHVGYFGGHSIYELGNASDVELFFYCLNKISIINNKKADWHLIQDRFYKRYLKLEELDRKSVV